MDTSWLGFVSSMETTHCPFFSRDGSGGISSGNMAMYRMLATTYLSRECEFFFPEIKYNRHEKVTRLDPMILIGVRT